MGGQFLRKSMKLKWCLFPRVLKDLYFPNGDFLHAGRKKNCSWSWNSILHGRSIVLKGGFWVVGDGTTINIQRDRWIPQGELSCLVDIHQEGKVAELLDNGNNGWNIEKIRELFDPNSVQKILQIPVSLDMEGVASPNIPTTSDKPHGELWKQIWALKRNLKRLNTACSIALGPGPPGLPPNCRSPLHFYMPIALVWSIWKTRNDFHFNNKTPDPMFTITRTMLFLNHFHGITEQGSSRGNNTWRNYASFAWRPPQTAAVKFNCDASFNKISKAGTAAVVARDHEGIILAVSSEKFFAPNSLVAEALAVRAGCILASSCGWPQSYIESDNQVTIEGIGSGKVNWEIHHIIEDIKRISSYLPHCGFLWTNRQGNKVAHALADAVARRDSPIVSSSSIPREVKALTEVD
ncbi:Ribonuclease H-like superfamily [Sesbania bispinosa]|nr:Ribonuclease H-like superfamily [Sesbania bispinosa]